MILGPLRAPRTGISGSFWQNLNVPMKGPIKIYPLDSSVYWPLCVLHPPLTPTLSVPKTTLIELENGSPLISTTEYSPSSDLLSSMDL